jgi:hypothetical protein
VCTTMPVPADPGVYVEAESSDNDSNKSKLSKCEQVKLFGLICFFPCIVLGEMSTKVSREVPLRCYPFSSCCGGRLGGGGCCVCLQTCVCCALGWPFSPALACYVCVQRRNLSRIYPADAAWVCGDACCGLCWPGTLLAHKRLVAQKEQVNILHYPWAYDLPKAVPFEEAAAAIQKRTLFLIGPPNSGKSTLLKKLCTVVGNEKLSDHHMYIDIKVAALPYSNIGPFTLEVWDIPEKFIASSLAYKPDFVFLTYDSGDKDSLLAAQEIYGRCSADWLQSCKSIHLVATMIDTWEDYGDDDIGPYEQTGAEWRTECIELAIEAEQWTKENNKALHFSLISNPMNEGVRKLIRSISEEV